jgi:hypothetical protein
VRWDGAKALHGVRATKQAGGCDVTLYIAYALVAVVAFGTGMWAHNDGPCKPTTPIGRIALLLRVALFSAAWPYTITLMGVLLAWCWIKTGTLDIGDLNRTHERDGNAAKEGGG